MVRVLSWRIRPCRRRPGRLQPFPPSRTGRAPLAVGRGCVRLV